ncbi:putative membrane protein SpoIIM required for sporulation [Lewinella aquimaris]|uniref:Putative membrane protein SpoIIM required for sporulation n=1 Tax=Neolewinella aquimaris TaxID=1835722 RepID=A0A840E796_9BACT|nr:stage II sporulation protein M [Neolewinella aquimaris]MBB4080910.1 putative membrane protein SpoIIM required for sporulation [Neolewinella aquimaris]
MRETDFIERNKDKWERYEEALKRSDQDPELLSELYVHTTDDLSISRTFFPNRSVRVYLNGLAQRTFLRIYRGRRGELSRFLTFWTDELPRTVYHNRLPLAIALAVFLLSMLIGILSYRIDPDFAEMILGADYVRMTEANIADGDPMAVYGSQDEFGMALHITLNNLFVALLTFVVGAFFCVGSIVMLVRNGVMLGVFQYFFYARGDYSAPELDPATGWLLRGLSWLLTAGGDGLERVFATAFYLASGSDVFRESLLTIWIHGALEISSIVIAGGAGITMGSGLLFPDTLTRLQAFGRSARAGIKIMLGTVPLFIVAGFLEGYVTRQTDLPDGLRFAFILFCFLFVGWYYIVYPRTVAKRGEPSLPAGRVSVVESRPRKFWTIRSTGEQLSLTFAVLRNNLGRLLSGALLLALVYCLLSFSFGGPAEYRYQFVAYLFGDFENFYELTASFGRGRALSFSVLVALGFYGMFRLALDLLYRYTDLVPTARSSARELRLLAVCGLLALGLSFSGAAVALVVFLTFPFLVTLGVSGYIGGPSPAGVFRMTYTNLAVSYGLFFLIILVAFPLIYLLDTVIGQFFFAFLDWIVYTDASTIDARNVVLQAFCYYFLFVLVFCSWVVAFAASLGTLQEIETAAELRQSIQKLGRKRRLRGMERE